ncbi:hypothetical protein [Aliterella atlantica]|uniref:Uncharacterized protein n=1 Tax=Aliterella atlantica CENA595 TaxID=1618023 RepID=A0A0D8ZQM1_9CYAN|nr:hypothetical protein [Aliterella atlantica]KJH69511.1 hypothetical protein UH38_23435 [Aliterella atlantica CENA595]
MYYYNCLLQGAVKTIIELEANNKLLNLSTNIEQEVKEHKLFGKLSGRKVFYFLIYLALVAVDVWCGWIGLGYGVSFVFFILSILILICLMWSFFNEDIRIILQGIILEAIKLLKIMKPKETTRFKKVIVLLQWAEEFLMKAAKLLYNEEVLKNEV